MATTSPYENTAHRPGCGCPDPRCQRAREVHDAQLATAAQACRLCGNWKRRDPVLGTCWHPAHPAPLTHQDDGAKCEHFGARAYFVQEGA